MGTPVTNFGKVTVSTGYTSAATSIVLTTGHGSRLPNTFPYPLVWWNSTDYTDPADDPNREIVTVTARTSDTLTVTRAAESTSASNKNTSSKTYSMVLSITKAMWDAIFTNSLSQSFRGLTLGTHPDSDVDDKKIQFSADAIVMNDGQEVQGWSNIVVDITASQVANGLDTGSEAASTWYSVWAIYNGTTKAGLLHREKDYFLDEDTSASITEDATQQLRQDTTSFLNTRIGQGFQVDTAGPVEFIDVKLIKVGTPSGNYWFEIQSNNGGAPSNTILATSDKYDASLLSTSAQWVRVPFRTPYSVSAATQYHVVMRGDYTISASNYLGWRMDGSAAGYTKGSKSLCNADTGGTWTTDTDDDMLLKVYVTRNDTAVTLPSGYTQRALIGYVYNDGSSNFKPFWQKDRRVFTGHGTEWRITNSFTTTAATLIDLSSYLPPVPVWCSFTSYNTSLAASNVLGRIPATDAVGTPTSNQGKTVRWTGGAAYTTTSPGLTLEYQAAMLATEQGTLSLWLVQMQF